MKTFAVIGDGSWGLALSKRLIASGHEVILTGIDNKRRTPKGVRYTNDLQTTLEKLQHQSE